MVYLHQVIVMGIYVNQWLNFLSTAFDKAKVKYLFEIQWEGIMEVC